MSGQSWIFRQVETLLAGGSEPPPPTPAERGRVLLGLVEAEFRFYGPTVARRRLPRTACYFARPLPRFQEFRKAVQDVADVRQLRALLGEFFR